MASAMVREAAVTALSDDARADTPAGRQVSALPTRRPPDGPGAGLFAARPSLIRAMNEI